MSAGLAASNQSGGGLARTYGGAQSSSSLGQTGRAKGMPTGFLSRSKSVGQIVGENGTQSSALLKNLENAVRDLEATISNDEKSLNEMDRQLDIARLEASRLQNRIDEEERFVEAMSPDKSLGAAMQKFDRSMDDVHQTYNWVREKHKDNIDILRNEFKYNPAYKKGRQGEFSAAYHTMAKDPRKIPVT